MRKKNRVKNRKITGYFGGFHGYFENLVYNLRCGRQSVSISIYSFVTYAFLFKNFAHNIKKLAG